MDKNRLDWLALEQFWCVFYKKMFQIVENNHTLEKLHQIKLFYWLVMDTNIGPKSGLVSTVNRNIWWVMYTGIYGEYRIQQSMMSTVYRNLWWVLYTGIYDEYSIQESMVSTIYMNLWWVPYTCYAQNMQLGLTFQ